MATLYEPLDLAVRGHFMPSTIVSSWLKTVGLLRKTRHRGRARVRWMFLFGLAAYNLVRIRNLAEATE